MDAQKNHLIEMVPQKNHLIEMVPQKNHLIEMILLRTGNMFLLMEKRNHQIFKVKIFGKLKLGYRQLSVYLVKMPQKRNYMQP